MDENIVSAELCNHYIIKLRELSDDIAAVRKELEEARQIIEYNWAGESGQASAGVVNRFDERFKSIDNSLSEAMNQIAGLSVVPDDVN